MEGERVEGEQGTEARRSAPCGPHQVPACNARDCTDSRGRVRLQQLGEQCIPQPRRGEPDIRGRSADQVLSGAVQYAMCVPEPPHDGAETVKNLSWTGRSDERPCPVERVEHVPRRARRTRALDQRVPVEELSESGGDYGDVAQGAELAHEAGGEGLVHREVEQRVRGAEGARVGSADARRLHPFPQLVDGEPRGRVNGDDVPVKLDGDRLVGRHEGCQVVKADLLVPAIRPPAFVWGETALSHDPIRRRRVRFANEQIEIHHAPEGEVAVYRLGKGRTLQHDGVDSGRGQDRERFLEPVVCARVLAGLGEIGARKCPRGGFRYAFGARQTPQLRVEDGAHTEGDRPPRQALPVDGALEQARQQVLIGVRLAAREQQLPSGVLVSHVRRWADGAIFPAAAAARLTA